jgi:hypothetical protein
VRPISTADGAEEIGDWSWDLITRCCGQEPDDRPTLLDIRKWLSDGGIQDDRPPAKPFPNADMLNLQSVPYGVDVERAEEILAQIKVGHR